MSRLTLNIDPGTYNFVTFKVLFLSQLFITNVHSSGEKSKVYQLNTSISVFLFPKVNKLVTQVGVPKGQKLAILA